MKSWKNITLDLPGKNLEEVMDRLIELDIISFTIKDKLSAEESIWFQTDNKPVVFHGDTHNLILLIEANHSTKDLIKKISSMINNNRIIDYHEDQFEDKDWVKHTQSNFKEIKISDSLRVIPPWKRQDNQTRMNTILINPGSGFGIGNHPTTKLCLDWLEKNIEIGEEILDFGSGSGILSILSKMYGAGFVLGVDIDQLAIDNAIYNSKLNGYSIPFISAKSFSTNHFFDTVIANILSSTLINLSPIFNAVTKKRLVLCGILDDQVDQIIKEYSKWIELELINNMSGWNLLAGKLKL